MVLALILFFFCFSILLKYIQLVLWLSNLKFFFFDLILIDAWIINLKIKFFIVFFSFFILIIISGYWIYYILIFNNVLWEVLEWFTLFGIILNETKSFIDNRNGKAYDVVQFTTRACGESYDLTASWLSNAIQMCDRVE